MFQNTGTHVPESFKSQNFLGKSELIYMFPKD